MKTNTSLVEKNIHNAGSEKEQSALTFRGSDYGQNIAITNHAEKITQAVYMLVDIMDQDSDLPSALRSRSFDFLGQVYRSVSPEFKDSISQIDIALFTSKEIVSYLNLAHYNKLISDMNLSVIVSELEKIQITLGSFIKDSNKKQASTEKDISVVGIKHLFTRSTQKDISPESIVSRYTEKTHREDALDTPVIVKKKQEPKQTPNPKPAAKKIAKKITLGKTNEAKNLRHKKILAALENNNGISTTDICSLFEGCSSKTIQRDLIELIDQNLVRKEGSRRWSTYHLA